MDDLAVRKRCEDIRLLWRSLSKGTRAANVREAIYRAAYADGMDAAASYIAGLDQCSKPSAIAAIIRNQAKEMGHE